MHETTAPTPRHTEGPLGIRPLVVVLLLLLLVATYVAATARRRVRVGL
jgi:hypothetical protein